jgi:hypothetical protein
VVKRKCIAMAVFFALFVLGATSAEAQWTHYGRGQGPTVINSNGYNVSTAEYGYNGGPGCVGSITACDPTWSWHVHNLTYAGTPTSGVSAVQQCMQIYDVPGGYWVVGCLEATYTTANQWTSSISVTHVGGGVSTLISSLQLATNQSLGNIGIWLNMSEHPVKFGATWYDDFVFEYSYNGTSWTVLVQNLYYLRSGNGFNYPTNSFTMSSDINGNLASAAIDSWTTYETAGRTTPTMFDHNLGQFPTGGEFCDADECAAPGQYLYYNQ